MRSMWLVLFLLGLACASPAAAQELFGSGSTFIFPIMSKWIGEYEKARAFSPFPESRGLPKRA